MKSYWILPPFLSEASRYYFFENRWKKLKYPNLLKLQGTINQKEYWSFYPSEPIQKISFNVRHPVAFLISKWNYSMYPFQDLLGQFNCPQVARSLKMHIFELGQKKRTWVAHFYKFFETISWDACFLINEYLICTDTCYKESTFNCMYFQIWNTVQHNTDLMIHSFELQGFFDSKKNMHLKALL